MKNISIIASVVAAVVLGAGCERPGPVRKENTRPVMGTLATVTVVASDDAVAAAAIEAAHERIGDVNRLMSTYQEDSEISQLNQAARGTQIAVSAETFECLKRALEICRLSGGAFDVTCRPLVGLWRAAGVRGTLPTDAELAAAVARVGCESVDLHAAVRGVRLTQSGMEVDLGGIAKGYALDLAAEAIMDAGASSGLVDIGGDIRATGERSWRIGVRHPFRADRSETICVLEVNDRAVATSGNQERYTEIEGRRFSHIVDPRTGWPAEQAPSVTVIAADGTTADGWATALSVLDVEEGAELLASLPDERLEVMWFWKLDGRIQVRQTGGFDVFFVEWTVDEGLLDVLGA